MERFTDVSDIVDSSRNIDGYEKELLKNLFKKLESNQENLYKQIEVKVEKQLCLSDSSESCWNICTALIDNDNSAIKQASHNGYHEIVHVDSNREVMKFMELDGYKDDDSDISRRGNVYAGTMFLDCKYSEIISLKKDYSGMVYTDTGSYEVKYNLIPYYAFMDEEKKLEQTALQYGIKVPLIYSPMSRRAVVVKVSIDVQEITKHGDFSIDFQYEKNGLDNKIFVNKTLLWNVENEWGNRSLLRENAEKKITSYFDKTFVIYSFDDVKENVYYYVQSDNHDIRRIEGSVYVGIDNKTKIEQIDYQKFTVNPVNKSFLENIMSFENKYDSACCAKKRVRTKGDVYNVLSCFDINYEEILFKPKYEAVCTYGKDYKYHYPTDEVLISSSEIYIKLSDNNDDKFFEDYVSYVFAYLNYYYPEFRWVGVK